MLNDLILVMYAQRLILGFNSQTSEAEPHILSSRLQGAKRAAAERGGLRLPLPELWAAPTTSNRDRKRLLRTPIADVTLVPDIDRAELHIGAHWRSGATEEVITQRMSRSRWSRWVRLPPATRRFDAPRRFAAARRARTAEGSPDALTLH